MNPIRIFSRACLAAGSVVFGGLTLLCVELLGRFEEQPEPKRAVAMKDLRVN